MLDTSRQDNILNRLQNVLGPLKKSLIIEQKNQLQNYIYSKYLVDSREIKDIHENYQNQNQQKFKFEKRKQPYIYRNSKEKEELKLINQKYQKCVQNQFTLRDKVFQDLNKHKKNVKQLLQINQIANRQKNGIDYDINMNLTPKYIPHDKYQKFSFLNLNQRRGSIEQNASIKPKNQQQIQIKQEINHKFIQNDTTRHKNNHQKTVSQITKRNIRNREMFINDQTNKLLQQQLKYKHQSHYKKQLVKRGGNRYPLEQKLNQHQNSEEPTMQTINMKKPIKIKQPAYFYCQQIRNGQKQNKIKHSDNRQYQKEKKQKLNYFISHNLQVKPKIVEIHQLQSQQNSTNELLNQQKQQEINVKKWQKNKVQLEFVLNKKVPFIKKNNNTSYNQYQQNQKQKQISINDYQKYKQQKKTQTQTQIQEITRKNIQLNKISKIQQKSTQSELLTNRLKSISHLNSQINNRIRNIVSTFQEYLSSQNQSYA